MKNSSFLSSLTAFALLAIVGILMFFLSGQLTASHSYNTYFTTPEVNSNGFMQSQDGISVNGSATVYIAPDLAVMNFGIETRNKDIRIAQQENSENMEALIKAFQDLGIKREDMQTSNYSVYPRYEDDSWRYTFTNKVPEVSYYSVNNTLTVQIKNLDKIEEAFSVAVETGATEIGSIEFTLQDFADAREEAYKNAAKIVTERAQYVAESMGVKVGPALSINASHYSYSYYSPYSNVMNQAVSFEGSSYSGGDSISSGQIQVKVDISAKYGIEY